MQVRTMMIVTLALAATMPGAMLEAQGGAGSADYRAGRAALMQDRAGDAIKSFERAVAAEGSVADYHYWLGTALGVEAQRAGRLKQASLGRRARDEFERAVQLDARHVAARQGLVQFYTLAPGFIGGSMVKARAQAAEIARISPFHGHLAHGMVAERSKDDAGARRAYEAAIAASPDSAAGYLALGLLHQRHDRWEDAFAVYERLQRARPADGAVLYHIGRAASLSGHHLDRGEQALRRYLASPPREATAYNVSRAHQRLAAIHERQGRRDLARQQYELAVKVDGHNSEAKRALKGM
ncbi:MAG TPA: tetratricopeptide repeat protein [Gemmatimonadaceae bacterium]|nr:tetratricopeptide repeat protein [Gemmatimonadaceae bacterium]